MPGQETDPVAAHCGLAWEFTRVEEGLGLKLQSGLIGTLKSADDLRDVFTDPEEALHGSTTRHGAECV